MLVEIIEIIKNVTYGIEVEPEQELINSGILDSLAMFDLVNEIEENYKIELDGEDIVPENFTTPRNIEDLLKRYVDVK